MSFEDLVQLPIYQRRVTNRKRVFMSFWMTSDENKIIQKIEAENAKKEESKRKKKTKKEAVKAQKVKAAIKRKQKKNVIKKIKSNPKLYVLKDVPVDCQIR